jgi:hypothetical protein
MASIRGFVCLAQLEPVCQLLCCIGPLGGYRLHNFVFKPATGVLGTRGGIVILWNENSIHLTNCAMGEFHLSADIEVKECSTNFRLSVVYGPTRHRARQRFLEELKEIKPENNTRWLILGDFNLIYKAADKNNRRLNHRLMRQFRDALNECEPEGDTSSKSQIHVEQ